MNEYIFSLWSKVNFTDGSGKTELACTAVLDAHQRSALVHAPSAASAAEQFVTRISTTRG